MLWETARFKMPAWHEDACRMRDDGKTIPQIVDALKESGIEVSKSRVNQVTGRWRGVADGERKRAQKLNAAGKKENQMDRVFEKVSAQDPTDVYHRVRMRCAHDGCHQAIIFARRGPINNHQAAQWFRDKGWGVGGGPRADLCPEHFKRVNGASKPAKSDAVIEAFAADTALANMQTMAKVTGSPTIRDALPPLPASPPAPIPVSAPAKPEASAEQVPAMTRTDRRLINAKLNDVYIDEERGYRAEWSDAKVAIDLGCRAEWVAEIREENFGPDTNEVDAGMEKMLSEKMRELEHMTASVLACIKTYDANVEAMDAKLDTFEKSHAELKALLMQINKRKEAK